MSADLTSKLISMMVPQEYLKYFDASDIHDYPDRWEIELKEKEDLIPEKLKGKIVVKDGFCNAIRIMSHCFSLKPVSLKLMRRRWKEPNDTIHFSNEYELHPDGAKITNELAAFLKGED